jgi:hypothetical protein
MEIHEMWLQRHGSDKSLLKTKARRKRKKRKHLPNMHKAMGFISNTTEEKKNYKSSTFGL